MLEKALRTFEDLIRRSLAPSLAFLLIALTVNLLGAQISGGGAHRRLKDYKGFVEWAASLESSGLIFALAILLIIGLSYALATVQQALFDNCLKANFEPLPTQVWSWLCAMRDDKRRVACCVVSILRRLGTSVGPSATAGLAKSEHHALKQLREAVETRLGKVHDVDRLPETGAPPTDYILYEILGGIDPTPTRPFVDSAKAMGIFFTSAILVLVGNALFNHEFCGWWKAVLVALAALSYWAGFNLTATQYRARALRLYVNFIAMPTARIEYLLFKEERSQSSGETRSP